jgi:hypothetical protein
MKRSINEKRVLTTLKSIIIFESILFSTIYGILLKLPKEYDTFLSYVLVTIITLLIQFLMFLLKDNFALKMLHKLTLVFRKNEMVGTWNLVIQYENENENSIVRTGPCKIEESFLGLKITGGKIYDNNTRNVEVDSWVAEKADVFSYESKVIFQYQYITYDLNTDNPTKLGIVNAEKISADKYEGIFKDYKVDSGKIIREGSVMLWRESS